MKDIISRIVSGATDPNRARCLAREYLQARILGLLQKGGAFSTWAFLGGTALRFLFDMPRFSEDLDFSLNRTGSQSNFETHVSRVAQGLEREGYLVAARTNTTRSVQSAFLKFEGLLFELQLSPHPREVLSIKLELDTDPPQGAGLATSIIRKHLLLNLLHHDRASLLSGKLHAILSRPYTKGRDMYDLLWYLSDRSWPEPNTTLLKNALQQTGWTGPAPTRDNWRKLLATKLLALDWEAVKHDLAPFVEDSNEMELVRKEHLLRLLESR